MGKIRKSKLCWQASDSDEIIGYRLYWSKGNRVSYDSNFFELGKVAEVYLPDVLKLDTRYETSLMLGITAVDINGNESDMITLPAPYKTKIPPAPSGLTISAMDDYLVENPDAEIPEQVTSDSQKITQQVEQNQSPRRLITPLNFNATENRIKYYDDVGYRKLDID